MTYREPKTIECKNCDNPVTLASGWANECAKCGREYNGSGQLLNPRSMWGEETGEDFGRSSYEDDWDY
jgi:hypothetical protein